MSLTPHAVRMSTWGWLFNFGIDELHRAYKAARSAPDSDRESLEHRLQEFKAEVAAGRTSPTEEDENGQVIHDYGEHAGELIYEVERVLRILRETFTISLHHFWERELHRCLNVTRYDEKNVFAFLKSEGLSPDEPMLTALRVTANVAKHSGGTSADQLFTQRADLFDNAEMAKSNHLPSYQYLLISDQALEDFFEAVRKSGPQKRPGWS